MNILFLHSSSGLYGGSKIMLETIQLLKQDFGKVIVCLPEEGDLRKALEDAGAEVIVMPLGILRRKYFNPLGLINRLYYLLKAAFKIRSLVKQHKIDIVYSNTTAVLAGAIATRFVKVKHLLHIHEIIEEPKFFANFIAKVIKKGSDKSIVVSNAVKQHWDGVYGGDDGIIKVVHNGIIGDAFGAGIRHKVRDEIKIDDSVLLVGMIGRVHYWKGQSYYLDLVKEISDRHDNVKFLMVGDAYPGYEYLYDEINEKIAKYGLEEKVIQMRFRRDIPDIMAALDIFILPSILPDPFPTVILESMHASTPIVATAQGGAMEMIDPGVTGYHIPIGDSAAAIKIFESLLHDSEKRKQFGDAGKKRVSKEFSVDKYTRRMREELQSLLKK